MAGIVKWVQVHRKLLVFIIGAALTIAIQIWGTGNLYVSAAILVATGLGLYRAPNETPAAKVPPPSADGSGTTRAVRVTPAAGTSGPAPSGAAFVVHHYPPGPGWRRW
jgi:hypothetical protein